VKGEDTVSKFRILLATAALAAVLGISGRAAAQQITYGTPVVVSSTETAPPAAAAAPAGTTIVTSGPCCAPLCTKKICVAEPKKSTKVVYDEVCKGYCRRTCHFSLFSMFGHHGCDSCCDSCNTCNSCCECGKPHVKHVLVKRNIPDCDTTNCVVKEVLVD